MSEQYETLYSDIASIDLQDSMQPLMLKAQKAQQDLRRIQKCLIKSEKPKILEVGPGGGFLSRELMALGSLYVTDITNEYLRGMDYCSQKFLSNVEDLPFDNEFDLIVLCDVLEHVLNEGDAILSIRRALKPGGLIYARCPSNEPLINYAQIVGSPFSYVHLRTYSPRRFKDLANHSGFKVIRSRYLPNSMIGFARRSFGIQKLKVVRSQRHTLEIMQSFGIISRPVQPTGLDKFLVFIESVTWYFTNKLRALWLERLVTRIWYRPSESFLLARKVSFAYDVPKETGLN